MRKYFLPYFVIGILLIGNNPLPSSAQTKSEAETAALQQQIQSLLQQVAELQAKLAIVQSSPTSAPSSLSQSPNTSQKHLTPPPALFSKTLRKGIRGDEVKKLQAILKQFSDIYPGGLVNGYFGPLTEVAVKRFQEKYGLEQAGIVGPKTREVLNSIGNRLVTEVSGLPTSNESPSSAPPPVPPPSGTLPAATTSTPKGLPPYFSYTWQGDDTLIGETRLPVPAPRPIVVLDGAPTVTLDTSAAVRLAQIHKIVLADDEIAWDAQTAGMLLEMIRRLPDTRYKFGDNKPWRVTLSDKLLTNDVEITAHTKDDAVRKARISKTAFRFSNPTLQPSTDGNSDRVFYSNRLFRATLRTFFNERYLLEDILAQRYGVKPGFADPRDEFQEFTQEELQYLITVLEDMPSGFHNIPGLEKIVRRKNGLTNPYHPGAPAIAWVGSGYIEFMDSAFVSGSEDYIRRLIAHEMTHFLWHKVLSEETKQQFMALSGWSQTPSLGLDKASQKGASDHPKAQFSVRPSSLNEIWYRKTTINFASDYAAFLNPDEDFAETVSYYIYQPDKVRTIAPDKYAFIRDIINRYEYVVLIDKRFTFQVFNLEPDVTFPGKIIGVDIDVAKSETSDNRVSARLHLSKKSGDGAERAYARIISPVDTTYVDVYFYPEDGNKYLLRADFTIVKSAARGYWTPTQITVENRVDNRRYEGQNQFGWMLFINNPDEDREPPVAHIDRIRSEVITNTLDHTVKIYIPISDNADREGITGRDSLHQYESGQSSFVYADFDKARQELVYSFPVRSYHARGTWTFREFWIFDIAGNERRYDLKEKALTFSISPHAPDYTKPELNISSIRIQALPQRPQTPDGETDVTIWYIARDDNSGLGNVNYQILKPTGDTLFDYHYHDNFYTPYFEGGLPTDWKQYEIHLTLPPGSPPGTWILQQIVINDKAGNILTSSFIETGILKPFEVK
ncbi:MAG: peptidoglycan-binding protein [Candidatus Colwellbacteria bacterium]|nr:peptidoglycan-binding protein [Candidatus Colwellbacteria bacterium]